MRERHRRDRADTPGASAFAATPIDLTRPEDAVWASAVLSASRAKSKTSWDWYDKLGEIHYGVGRQARIGGYAKLRVCKLEPNGDIGEEVTGGLAGEIGDSLYSPYGGTRGFVERFLTLMKVPADSYLIECRNGKDVDGYDFVSADEIRIAEKTNLLETRSGANIQRITLPAKSRWGDVTGEERLSPAQFLGRVWRPSSRYVDLPDSPLAALDTSCEVLHLLTIGLRAKLLSRLASNGVFYVPSEVNDARSAAPTGEPGEFHQNKVLNELIKAAVFAARNPDSPEAAIPIFMTGPGVHAEQFRHIVMDQQLYETDMKLRAELIDRILTGLDIMPSQVKGANEASHWASWSASDDEMRVSVQPDLETLCWALTRLVLWRRMKDAGQKPGAIMKHVVWYDLSRSVSTVNPAEGARQAFDRILISPPAARKMQGLSERDKPDAVEYIRMLGVKIADPYLATFGMSEQEQFDWERIGSVKTGPAPDSTAPDSQVGPGKGNPGSPADNKSKTPARLRPA